VHRYSEITSSSELHKWLVNKSQNHFVLMAFIHGLARPTANTDYHSNVTALQNFFTVYLGNSNRFEDK
jgi:hypothetical protein